MDSKYADCIAAARALVDQAFLDDLRKPRASAAIFATALVWLQMALAWTLALLGPLWLIWVPFLMTCALTQAMLLWVHESSHYLLFSNRRTNDIWCDLFFAGPVGMSVGAYRAKHLTHHAHLGTEKDEDSYPYRLDIKGRRHLFGVMVRTLSGLMGIWLARHKYLGGTISGTARSYSPRWLAPLVAVVFNAAVFGLCIWSGRWYVYPLIWVYPILAVAIAINVIRTIAEHQPEDFTGGGTDAVPVPVVRTTTPNWFEKWMMYQANFNYHVEHHMFPGIPQHNLPRLHVHLVRNDFYRRFPDALQSSGFSRFLMLARSNSHDFSDALQNTVKS